MKRRIRTMFTIAIVVVTMLSIGIHAPRSTQAATPGVYIALGDSIAAGIGSSLPRTRGNAALVAQWLARLSGESVPHESLAAPGETAASFVDGGQLERLRDSVARSSAASVPIAAVTLALGGNELLGLDSSGLSDRQAGLDSFSNLYAEALSAVRSEIGAETPLVALTYYDLTEGDATIQFSDAWWVEQFNEVIRRVAAEHGARVADIAPRFENRIGELTHYPFDIHPSNAGHLAIARAIWETLDVDRENPRITVASDIEATRATPTVRFTVEDNVGVQSVTARSDDVTLRGPFQVDDNAYAILLDLTTTGLAEVALTIEIGDDAGNTSFQEVTVQVADAGRSES